MKFNKICLYWKNRSLADWSNISSCCGVCIILNYFPFSLFLYYLNISDTTWCLSSWTLFLHCIILPHLIIEREFIIIFLYIEPTFNLIHLSIENIFLLYFRCFIFLCISCNRSSLFNQTIKINNHNFILLFNECFKILWVDGFKMCNIWYRWCCVLLVLIFELKFFKGHFIFCLVTHIN